MKIKNKLENLTVKTEKFNTKKVLQDLMKKMLVSLMITTNLFFYMPTVIFAEDEDNDKRVPATVPAVANEIISKYVNTSQSQSGGSSSSGYGVISTYEESGDGWDTITKVEYPNGITRTYRNYLQWKGSYAEQPYWDNVIRTDGCGPATIATALTGYGYDVDPGDVVDVMDDNELYNSAIDNLVAVFKLMADIESKNRKFDADSKDDITESLENGRPVVVNYPGHFIIALGVDKQGNIIYSDPGYSGRESEYGLTINALVDNCRSNGALGYILITSDSDAKSGGETSNKKDNTNKKSSSTSSGTGTYSIDEYPSSQYGYASIFTSGTTGKKFKEYKQNIPGWDSKYKISDLPGTNKNWTGECGLVSTMIVGSGYTERATFEDATQKMIENDGWTTIPTWTSDYTGQSVSFTGYSSSEMVDKLSQGYVAIIHGTSYNVSSGGTHYMAILDIKPDKSEVYVSNPWEGSKYDGWLSVSTVDSDFGADSIAYIKNDGSVINYNGSAVTTLDNFLFIGDSRTAAIESDLKKLGNNITAKGVSSSKPSDWEEVIKTGSGLVLGTSVTLPPKSSVKGVSVALGVNGTTSQIKSMKNVLNNLLERYPDTPIFVNSVFYVGQGYTLISASTMNSDIDKFNKEIKEFCNSDSNLIYIDITKDLYESNYLKAAFTGDDVHLNTSGNEKLVENIKNAILGSGRVRASSSSGVNMSRNIVPNDRKGYKIDIDLDEEVELMLERLKEEGFKLGRYLEKSLQKKHLKNYLKAAIVTQYPDLRSAKEIAKDDEIKDPKEVQGCIKVKRYADGETEAFAGNSLSNPKDSDDDAIYLSYKPYDELTDLINSGDKSALNYFSLDSNNNMVVAGWETLEVSVTIEQTDKATNPDPDPDPAPAPRKEGYSKLIEKRVDYINQVSNYTVPFSFLWSLLVYGNDEKFVNDFAQLVIDTEIVLGCYDATTIQAPTYTYTYTDRHTTNRGAGIGEYNVIEGGRAATATSSSLKEYHYKVTETHTLKTDNPSLKVKYANTWTAIYDNEYKVVNKKEDSTPSTVPKKDEQISSDVDYKYDEETDEIVNGDEALQKDIDSKIEELSKKTSEYNHKNFAYRYEKLNKSLNERYYYTEEQGGCYKLLHEEDVQNYLINMIITENSKEYISNTFKNNDTITRLAKKISATDYVSVQDDAAACANRIVEELEINNLKNELTKNGTDTRPNKTYSSEVTSVTTEEIVTKVDQEETLETNTTKAEVQSVTTGTNQNVIMKIDKNSDENSFVKLLHYSKRAKSNFKLIDSWFFKSMENTAAIADMVDLVKYLFNEVYNGNTVYTKEQINEFKNLFDPTKFNKIGGTSTVSGTSLLSEFLKCWENAPMKNYIYGKTDYNSSPYVYMCITEDKKNYIMCDDLFTGNNNRNYGFGICFYVGRYASFQNTSYFADEGIDITDSKYQTYGVSTLPVEIVDRIKGRIIEDNRQDARNLANSYGVTLTDYQIDAIAACRYQGWIMDDFLAAYKAYGMDSSIRSCSTGMGTSTDRYNANWKLFSTGVYTDENGDEIVLKQEIEDE